MFFDCLEQQTGSLVPFVKDGIAQSDRSLLLIEGNHFGSWKKALEANGVDVHAGIEAGNLSFRANSRWLQPEEFNSIRMARRVWESIERSLEHHSSVRVVADLTWTLEAGVSPDQVCHWEATLDCLLSPDIPAKVICMYDCCRLPSETLHAALRTHRGVLLEKATLGNAYYEAPAILASEPHMNECSSDVDQVRRMLNPFLLPSNIQAVT
jgi:hypothetical protein